MSDPEYVNLDGAARRRGLRLGQLRRIRRAGDFPEPAGTDGAEPYWRDETVLRWAGRFPTGPSSCASRS